MTGQPALPAPRFLAIDAIRGFAVMGILVMNIVAFGMPEPAYVDPLYYGMQGPADVIAWAIAFVLADGKMRALFTMLFGVSMLIAADHAEDARPGPAATHYTRMAWLFAFGMAHAWLFWFGDILVEYALVGAIAFMARHWRKRALGFAAIALIAYDIVFRGLIPWIDITSLRDLATKPGTTAEVSAAWRDLIARVTPDPSVIARELRLYRGGFADAFAARAVTTQRFQSALLVIAPGSLGVMLLGMWLHKLGFWIGAWPRAAYRRVIAIGALALALHVPLALALVRASWDPAIIPLIDAIGIPLRVVAALGYAAALILIVASRRAGAQIARLAAAGRMALSNYLGTTLVATTIFYGYGFGLFGYLRRVELYVVVAFIWLIILGSSQIWLSSYRYGPAEWLWRSLSRLSLQPMRKS